MKVPLLRSSYHIFLSALLYITCSHVLSGQTVVVTDEGGVTLPGVEVYSADRAFGELTDIDGEVTISKVVEDMIIHFRYLGYEEVLLTLDQIRLQDYQVSLVPSQELLEEVVVLGRKSVAQSEIPFQIKTIDLKDIAATQAQTSADALGQHGGVYIQKSQMGGGSPVIRGFEANRVLLVVDDIRLNNAIYRSGHLQNAITVDQAMLERMDVIFGPNSLMYGSDALGGVVNFRTRNPRLSLTSKQLRHETNYYVRYATANKEKSAHIDHSIGGVNWGSLTSISYSDYDDLRSGNRRDERFPDFGKRLIVQSINDAGDDISVANPNPNIQIGTGYEQIDVLQKFLWTPGTHHRVSANIQYSTGSDVPRYDNLSEIRNGQLRWAEWSYGPQKRLLTALDYRHIKPTKLYDQLIIIGAYQKIDEDRISRRFGNDVRSRQEEDVSVYSLTVDASKPLGQGQIWTLEYGADIQHNVVHSGVSGIDVRLGTPVMGQLTRYASDQNHLTNIGAYGYLKGSSVSNRLNYNAGVRYARSTYQIRYDENDPIDWPSDFFEGINSSNKAVTWSVGSTWAVNSSWQLRSMISTAFRSPNIDDIAKIRINGSEITFPNVSLKPERSSNAELTIAYQLNELLKVSMTGFYTKLSDAIVRDNFLAPNGSDTWISQGDTLLVVANVNAKDGDISGLSFNISGDISDTWSWYGSLNLTRGRQTIGADIERPLSHIPPAYGKIGLDYHNGPLSLKAIFRYNTAKPIESYGGSEDNPDLATAIGALGWSTANLYASYDINDVLTLSLAGENLTDLHYRPFASGVSAAGRNVILSFRGKF